MTQASPATARRLGQALTPGGLGLGDLFGRTSSRASAAGGSGTSLLDIWGFKLSGTDADEYCAYCQVRFDSKKGYTRKKAIGCAPLHAHVTRPRLGMRDLLAGACRAERGVRRLSHWPLH